MTVKELITYLQVVVSTAGNKPVIARDENGTFSTYIDLCNDPDRFIIDAWPEPDTQNHKQPFDLSDSDRCLPWLCNGDFDEFNE